jgi:glycosyltransferase involved in cell wall biosynthesis
VRPDRVGVLTTSFPRWPGDFAGAFVEDAVRDLVATGVEVDVLAAGDAGAPRPAASPIPGVRVHRAPLSRPPPGTPCLFYSSGAPEVLEGGGLAAWLQAVHLWAGMCRLVSALAPAWLRIEAHWLVPCGLAARAVAPHLPLSIRAHSGDVALLERLPGGRSLARYLARPGPAGLPTLGFVTRDLKDRFARLAGLQVGSVVPVRSLDKRGEADHQGRESEIHAGRGSARQALGLSTMTPTFLSVGRLVPIKGYDVLIRAVAVASASAQARSPAHSPARRPTLVILGDGPERERLAALARRLDVDLRLPGFVPRAHVATWLQTADLYVQSSRRLPTGRTEGLPTATLEALAAGLPVVATETGGLAELPFAFAPPRLRLVPPDDPAALAACLEL